MSRDNQTLYTIGNKLSDLEAHIGATKVTTFYSSEYESTIWLMSDGTKWCKDEEGYWMEVIL